jgi:hypothetical protein
MTAGRVWAVLLCGLTGACASRSLMVSTLPVVGSAMPCRASDGDLLVVAEGELAPSCAIRWRGTDIKLYPDGTGRVVRGLITWDASFASPDGVRVGASIDAVRAAGGSAPAVDWGHITYSTLPSGWVAVWPGRPGHTDVVDLPSNATVQALMLGR